MLPLPRRPIKTVDEALDWWSDEVAPFYNAVGAQVNASALVHTMVDDIRTLLRAAETTPLSLVEASERSGYSPDHIGRLVRDGKIENVGRKNAPKVRAGDIPIKMKSDLATSDHKGYDVRADALSLVNTRRNRRISNAS